jgi:hypothetical protein
MLTHLRDEGKMPAQEQVEEALSELIELLEKDLDMGLEARFYD